jgi:hypothetical protein
MKTSFWDIKCTKKKVNMLMQHNMLCVSDLMLVMAQLPLLFSSLHPKISLMAWSMAYLVSVQWCSSFKEWPLLLGSEFALVGLGIASFANALQSI